MCIDDVRIARRTSSDFSMKAVTTSPFQLVPHNPKRVSLIIGAPDNSNITISINPSVTANFGIRLISSTHTHFTLTLADHGDLVTRAWFAVAASSTLNVAIFETLLDEV